MVIRLVSVSQCLQGFGNLAMNQGQNFAIVARLFVPAVVFGDKANSSRKISAISLAADTFEGVQPRHLPSPSGRHFLVPCVIHFQKRVHVRRFDPVKTIHPDERDLPVVA